MQRNNRDGRIARARLAALPKPQRARNKKARIKNAPFVIELGKALSAARAARGDQWVPVPVDRGPEDRRLDVTATVTTDAPADGPIRRRLLETTSEKRKSYPIATGLLDYFPDACAAVAEVSYLGNQKHNPGQPMHHARGKSMDHADCIARHLSERGGFDGGIRHSAALAWRAFALLQEELEHEHNFPLPRAARA